MKRAERLESILERLSDDGSVAVSELTGTLQASAATVRRDLELLEQQKLLSRTHGGAVGNGTLYELPVRYRGGQHAAEKRRIADAAALRVGEARTVGLSGGTTTTEVARRLRGRELTVVTNAVNIASELVVAPTIRLVVTGGIARPQTYELIGPLADATLAGLNLDLLFIGVDGAAAEGMTTHDEIEAQTDRQMVERARRVIVVCDSSKIGRAALAVICRADQVDVLITDAGAPLRRSPRCGLPASRWKRSDARRGSGHRDEPRHRPHLARSRRRSRRDRSRLGGARDAGWQGRACGDGRASSWRPDAPGGARGRQAWRAAARSARRGGLRVHARPGRRRDSRDPHAR